jgi:hypothetical protein
LQFDKLSQKHHVLVAKIRTRRQVLGRGGGRTVGMGFRHAQLKVVSKQNDWVAFANKVQYCHERFVDGCSLALKGTTVANIPMVMRAAA